MANILTKRYGRIQPPLGSILDEGHPFSLGMSERYLFNEGGGDKLRSITKNASTGTLTGMDPPTDWVSEIYGRALDFEGSNDYVAFSDLNNPSLAGLSSASFFANVKFDEINRTPGQWIGSEVERTNNDDKDWQFQMRTGLDIIRLRIDVSPSGNSDTVDAATNIVAGTWYHLGWTYDGTTMKIYVDGKEDGSQAHGTGGPIDDHGYGFRIAGQINSGSGCLNGRIDDVSLYHRTLAPNEVAHLYHARYLMIIAPQPPRYFSIPAVGGVDELGASFVQGGHFMEYRAGSVRAA